MVNAASAWLSGLVGRLQARGCLGRDGHLGHQSNIDPPRPVIFAVAGDVEVFNFTRALDGGNDEPVRMLNGVPGAIDQLQIERVQSRQCRRFSQFPMVLNSNLA
jgi:hypothetical protein